MPRGEPKIVVTYDIDADGILSVSAKETSTGREQSIQIKNDSGRLSQADINRMVHEAHAAEDEAHRNRLRRDTNWKTTCEVSKTLKSRRT